MSGLLRGDPNDEGWSRRAATPMPAARWWSRHGCAPAMPSKIELDDDPSRAAVVPRPDLDPRLNHLHRVTTRRREWPELCVMAFDHRSQLEDMAMQCGASLKRIPALKQLILQASREAASRAGLEGKAGLLCDGTFGQDALNAITGEGLWVARPIPAAGLPAAGDGARQYSAPSLSVAAGARGEVPGLLPPGRRPWPAPGAGAENR